MCNRIKCVKQYTDLNSNINRDVQEECAKRLYRVTDKQISVLMGLNLKSFFIHHPIEGKYFMH